MLTQKFYYCVQYKNTKKAGSYKVSWLTSLLETLVTISDAILQKYPVYRSRQGKKLHSTFRFHPNQLIYFPNHNPIDEACSLPICSL